MSYGAPCERGVGAADTMPQRDLEVPGLVPAVDGVGLATKEARRHYSQRARRRRRREEKSSRRERSVVDRDRCLGVIAEAVDDHRRELKVISRGLDLCESTLCSDVANVRTWVKRSGGAAEDGAARDERNVEAREGHRRVDGRAVPRGRSSRRAADSLAGTVRRRRMLPR